MWAAESMYYRWPMSIRVLLFVNLLTPFLALLILAEGIWMKANPYKHCAKHLDWLVIAIGMALFVLSIFGWKGAKRGKLLWLSLYVILLTLVSILFFILTVAAFIYSKHGHLIFRLPSGGHLTSASACNVSNERRFDRDWRIVAISSLVVLLVLIVLNILACSAFVNTIHRRVILPRYV